MRPLPKLSFPRHADDDRFWGGIQAFNEAQYFEAHEEWEDIWRQCDGDERELLAALIQVAAGFLKREQGAVNGARRLWMRSLGYLEDRVHLTPLDVASLLARLHAELAALDGGPAPDGPPQLLTIDEVHGRCELDGCH